MAALFKNPTGQSRHNYVIDLQYKNIASATLQKGGPKLISISFGGYIVPCGDANARL